MKHNLNSQNNKFLQKKKQEIWKNRGFILFFDDRIAFKNGSITRDVGENKPGQKNRVPACK